MYCKLFSFHNVFLPKAEQLLRDLIAKQLGQMEVAMLVQTYRTRLLSEPSFNGDDFFADLQGHLKFLYLEKHKFFSKSLLTRAFFSKLGPSLEDLLLRYSYLPGKVFFQGNVAKKISFPFSASETARIYSNPVEFFYKKLVGKDEVSLAKKIDNNLLTVTGRNLPGQPFDVIENVLPLKEVYNILYEKEHPELLEEIELAKQSNKLIQQLLPGMLGLAVRLDKQGNKKVYVVAVDLEIKHPSNISEPTLFSQLKEQYATLLPRSLNYDELVKLLPELAKLPAIPASK